MEKYMSLRQFARLAGVSPATVSQVYANPDRVKTDTVKRVLELADHIGFTPSNVARAAFGASTRSVGVVLPTFTDTFDEVALGIQKVLVEADYLPIFVADNGPSEGLLTRLLKHNVDAVIFGASDERINLSEYCRKQMTRLPVVVINTPRPGFAADSVLNDGADGGRQAAEFFLKAGHRQFGFCGFGEGICNDSMVRFDGFYRTLTANGGELLPCNIAQLSSDSSDPDIYKRLTGEVAKMLSLPTCPSAFFCASDHLALAVYEAARQNHLSIPDDLSVIGFGNLPFAAHLGVPLSSIRQNPVTLGEKTAEVLLDRLAGKDFPIQSILIPVQLINRKSVSPKK